MTALPCLSADEVEMPVAKFFLTHEALAPVEVHFGIHAMALSLIHISEPTRQAEISYAVFCLKKKKKQITKKKNR